MKSQISEAFYKSLYENMADGLAYCQMIFDSTEHPVDFVYLEVNKNFEKLTGLKEVIGKKITEIIPGIKTSNPELLEIFGQVSLTGEPKKFETYIGPLSKWFSVLAYSPQKKFFVILLQNITDQKQTEKNLKNAEIAALNVYKDLQIEKGKLAEAKAKDEALLESIGEGVIATDQDGKIMLMNQAAERMLGWNAKQVIGKLLIEVRKVSDEKGNLIPEAKRPITIALKGGSITITTTGPSYFYTRKDETKFPVAITVTPVIVENKIIGAIDVFRDISKEKEIDKAKTEFVSLASHQLRTPLTTISWYTEMIIKGDVGDVTSDQKEYLEEIYQGNQRMVELVDTLLDVSRIELGTFKVEPKPTDIIALAGSVLNEQKPKIEKKKFTVIQKFSKDIPAFLTDPKLLRMVFQNLLTNAVEYTPPGGRIEFTISFDDKKIIHITISDTGYGIPKNQQNQIFTKLFRADNVRDKDTDGTGLGLYIVKSIVENSGGKIWFESEENKGTTFYVTLPLDGMKIKEGNE